LALALAPATVSANSQLLRSCSYVHERKAWLFCGSELAGQRAAIVMSLVQSAKLNGHEPWTYLRDVLERLPTHPNSRIDELLPHRWKKTDA
jgi:IS66 C-terminal element